MALIKKIDYFFAQHNWRQKHDVHWLLLDEKDLQIRYEPFSTVRASAFVVTRVFLKARYDLVFSHEILAGNAMVVEFVAEVLSHNHIIIWDGILSDFLLLERIVGDLLGRNSGKIRRALRGGDSSGTGVLG